MSTVNAIQKKSAFIPVLVLAVLCLSLLIACNDDSGEIGGESHAVYTIGDYGLYLSSVGEGEPAVIIESGIGDGGTMSGWTDVRAQLKDIVRICLYDRAGLGKSEKGTGIRTTERIADDLHALLKAAKIEPPYVFVGHSLGGLHVQVYAQRYPGEIAGMVLVDPTPKELVDSLTDEQINNLKTAGAPQGVIDEAKEGLSASIHTFKSLPSLKYIPLEVLTSSYTGKSDTERDQYEQLKSAHKTLSEQVPDGKHVVASKAGHYIQIEEPILVADAIRRVCEKVKPGLRKYQ